MWANGKPPHLGCGHHQGSNPCIPIRGVSLFIIVSTDKINSGRDGRYMAVKKGRLQAMSDVTLRIGMGIRRK